ncbi:fungal-specific transcription factor domain-containing protein [Limtongia smithiae]|uniref:fungal-specific transcription factor domain-containing protein n=1 Tax=Limtongia smithiae TaxID=1125753 RepID=UPI0034CE9A60
MQHNQQKPKRSEDAHPPHRQQPAVAHGGGRRASSSAIAYAPLTPDTPPEDDSRSPLASTAAESAAQASPTEASKTTGPSSADKKVDGKEPEIVRRRTRTGCMTCRKRRIKCDENKPKCSNCIKSRRTCEGYVQRPDYRSEYFRLRSIMPPGDPGAAAGPNPGFAGYLPQGMVPYQQFLNPFIGSIPPDQLYAASNFYAAAATAAAAAAAAAAVANGGTNGAEQASSNPSHQQYRAYYDTAAGSGYHGQYAPAPAHPGGGYMYPVYNGRSPPFMPYLQAPLALPSQPHPPQAPVSAGSSASTTPTSESHGMQSSGSSSSSYAQWTTSLLSSTASTPWTPNLHSQAYSGYPLNPPSIQTSPPLPAPPQQQQQTMPTLRTSIQASNITDEADMYVSMEDYAVMPHLIPSLFSPPAPITVTPAYGAASFWALTDYRPDPWQSPLTHPAAQQLFRHFVHVIARQISLFERHVPEPERLVLIASQQMPQTKLFQESNIWTYHIPMMALQCPALLHAILALSAMSLSELSQSTNRRASLLHYHIAIRRLSHALQVQQRQDSGADEDLPIFAATLLLAFYETMTGEHDMWARHLEGASNMIRRLDIEEFLRDLAITDGDDDSRVEDSESRTRLRRRIDAETRRDLMAFFLRMEIMQCVANDGAPFLEVEFWDAIPKRGSASGESDLDRALWYYDDMAKTAVRVVWFVHRESERKRGRTPEWTAADAAAEWESLNEELSRGIAEFEATWSATTAISATMTPYGPPIRFSSAAASVIRIYLDLWTVALLRNHPMLTTLPAFKVGLMNVAAVAQRAEPFCVFMLRCIAGIPNGEKPSRILPFERHPQPQQMKVSPDNFVILGSSAGGATGTATGLSWDYVSTRVYMSTPLLFAGVQVRDADAQQWVLAQVGEIHAVTGWRSAIVISRGLMAMWGRTNPGGAVAAAVVG